MTEIEFYRKALEDYENAFDIHGSIASRQADYAFSHGFCHYAWYNGFLEQNLYDLGFFKKKLPKLYNLRRYWREYGSDTPNYMAIPGDIEARVRILKRAIKNYEKRSNPTVI